MTYITINFPMRNEPGLTPAVAWLYEEDTKLSIVVAESINSLNCPNCNHPMLIRKIRFGSNAGREFWGCSTFTRCRAVISK